MFATVTKQPEPLLEILFNCLVLHIDQDTLTLYCVPKSEASNSHTGGIALLTVTNFKGFLLLRWEGNGETSLPKMCINSYQIKRMHSDARNGVYPIYKEQH